METTDIPNLDRDYSSVSESTSASASAVMPENLRTQSTLSTKSSEPGTRSRNSSVESKSGDDLTTSKSGNYPPAAPRVKSRRVTFSEHDQVEYFKPKFIPTSEILRMVSEQLEMKPTSKLTVHSAEEEKEACQRRITLSRLYVENLKELFSRGFRMIKYSSTKKAPQKRYFYLNEDLTELHWFKMRLLSSKTMSEEHENQKKKSMIELASVRKVVIHPHNLSSNRSKPWLQVTLVTSKRSLDLEVSSLFELTNLVLGFQALVPSRKKPLTRARIFWQVAATGAKLERSKESQKQQQQQLNSSKKLMSRRTAELRAPSPVSKGPTDSMTGRSSNR
eukprot:TRINITY_DN6815_c0_g1_i1.p1 TRINITY_DN6815_c0_g1~~TRINITY_DN6815_c0_g1_i1.p1  ORF type:complete len:334 (-),score=64.15 TRINITY_DN6815_c0_g1_i1:862-1863(-)